MAGDCEDRPEDKFAGVLHPRARSVWRNCHSDWRGRRPTSRPPQFVHIGPQIARPHSAASKCQFKAYLSALTFGSSVERPRENPPTPAFQLTRRAVFDCLGPLVVARAHGRGRSALPALTSLRCGTTSENPTAAWIAQERSGALGHAFASAGRAGDFCPPESITLCSDRAAAARNLESVFGTPMTGEVIGVPAHPLRHRVLLPDGGGQAEVK
jgi:hypothetical protein